MREGWKYKKLGVVATFINGYPFKPSEWGEEGRPIIRIQNLNNPDAPYNLYNGAIDNKYIVSKGDVLISWSGSLGVYEWGNGTDALLNQHIFKVVFNKENINKSFFKYAVSSRINEMKGKVHGITMQHITKGDFDKTPIPVPSLSEQERIVAELDLLTDVIDKQKQQLKELDTLAQSIFYDMFGDPVENEKGWEIRRLGDLCDFISGFAFKSELFKSEGLPVLRISNIQNNVVAEEDMVYFLKSDYKEDFTKYEVHNGDIVIAMSGATTGKLGVHRGSKTYYLNQRVGRFDIKNDSVLNRCYLLFCLKRMSERILIDAMGVAQPNISSKQIREYSIPLAEIESQEYFADKIEDIEKQKEAISKSIDETQKLFDYTMDKYFG